ncbi:hypothetical protein ADK47_16505 [Streptomyces rimosus subsp. rimosus]|nr:hypothetical protein DF17_21670 [Streptomyces rimosus]KOG73087.1 hypothetical protein ADK78_17670 [Kitasatospora aureofaciens]KOT38635.1 hypothetical protein ADK42_16950 [Streptomyces rimosus subsp. rimosus]KOT38736.1 hypothetical protein ADK84_16195 [Streptomyces sp. NRRL WC-3701]KEF12016.1 hypothetical protein DF18_35895 [Streptomyces rimosus]
MPVRLGVVPLPGKVTVNGTSSCLPSRVGTGAPVSVSESAAGWWRGRTVVVVAPVLVSRI